MFKTLKGMKGAKKLCENWALLTREIVNKTISLGFIIMDYDLKEIIQPTYSFCMFFSYRNVGEWQLGVMIEDTKSFMVEWIESAYQELYPITSNLWDKKQYRDFFLKDIDTFFSDWVEDLKDENPSIVGSPLSISDKFYNDIEDCDGSTIHTSSDIFSPEILSLIRETGNKLLV